MKAVQVRKAYDLVTAEVKKPVLSKDDEVLVKVKRVGICGSDMHIYHGTNPLATLPRVIGHEVTGQVEAVGANVQSLKPGDHVVIEPISYCGSCYACRKGLFMTKHRHFLNWARLSPETQKRYVSWPETRLQKADIFRILISAAMQQTKYFRSGHETI